MRAGDLARDLGQGTVAPSLELEGVVEDDDRSGFGHAIPEQAARRVSGAAAPVWRRRAACFGGIGGDRRPGEALPRPFRQAAEFEFLQAIRDGSHKQIAADPRRLRATEPPPFLAQRRAVEILQPLEARLQDRGG